MHDKIKKSLARYKELISYATFGLGATLINMLAYLVLADILGIYFMLSNALAWGCAFTFAFVTNKLFVFRSMALRPKAVWAEFVPFVACRVATGLFTLVAMVVMVDGMGIRQDFICKVVVSGISLVLNYVLSKWFVFKKQVS